MAEGRKILVPNVRVKRVSIPAFVAYWVGLIIIVLGVGIAWGF